MYKLMTLALMGIFALGLTSCAAGSATAGYALRAREADSLSTQAEQRIVNRTKSEMRAELFGPRECRPCITQ